MTPSQSLVQTALRAFLLSILSPGIEVVSGQVNRVPPPSGTDYVVFTAMSRLRLETNVDTFADVAFTGSMTGSVLTASAIQFGSIGIGSTLVDVGGFVPANVVIQSQLSGAAGAAGTYLLSSTLAVPVPPEIMAAGNELLMQPTQLTFQVDVYGPMSSDNAVVISTMFRDDYAALWWTRNGYFTSTPLYADDPHQMPFSDESQQVETRWTVEAVIQVNATVTVPQQFMGNAAITLVNVDVSYPG